jgi:hypothetical protein
MTRMGSAIFEQYCYFELFYKLKNVNEGNFYTARDSLADYYHPITIHPPLPSLLSSASRLRLPSRKENILIKKACMV